MAFESMKNIMFSQSIMSTSTEQKEALGTLRVLSDGRKFRYCKNGAAAIEPGLLVMPVAESANHKDEDMPADASAGDSTIKITLGATAVEKDEYAGGFLSIYNATDDEDRGQQYEILSHPAHAGGGDLELTLVTPLVRDVPEDDTKLSLIRNRYKDVVVTTGDEVPVTGVTVCNVAAGAYFWAQSGGVATVVAGTADPQIGQMAKCSDNGDAEVMAGVTASFIGVAQSTIATGAAGPILLMLD